MNLTQPEAFYFMAGWILSIMQMSRMSTMEEPGDANMGVGVFVAPFMIALWPGWLAFAIIHFVADWIWWGKPSWKIRTVAHD